MRAHSFTSDRIPRTSGWPLLLLILLLFILFAASLELLLRTRGLSPSHFDVPETWALRRIRTEESGGGGLVIVGSSRSQIGIRPSVLAPALAKAVHQLSINGGSPFPVLEDFVRGQASGFTFLIEFAPHRYATPDDKAYEKARRFVDVGRKLTFIRRYEHELRFVLRERVVLLSPAAGLRSVLSKLGQGRLPSPSMVSMDGEGSITMRRPMGLSPEGEQGTRRYADIPRLPSEALSARVEDLREQLDLLASRGNQVAFVRMPVCSVVLEDENENFHDVWTEYMEAIPFVSWLELDPRFRPECVDGSHLTAASAEAFTNSLALRLESIETL